MCIRFFVVLPSGTFMKSIRGYPGSVAHSPAFQSSRPESADLLWVVGIEDDREERESRFSRLRPPDASGQESPDHPVYEKGLL